MELIVKKHPKLTHVETISDIHVFEEFDPSRDYKLEAIPSGEGWCVRFRVLMSLRRVDFKGFGETPAKALHDLVDKNHSLIKQESGFELIIPHRSFPPPLPKR